MVRLKGKFQRARGVHAGQFQFHSGSIKSRRSLKPTAGRSCGFNSIVVRLKDRRGNEAPIFQAEFQFHSGSIKRESAMTYPSFPAQFQFHSGSIKSNCNLGGCIPYFCFNSIVVRLKEPKPSKRPTCPASFNSIVVRLKASAPSSRPCPPPLVSIP